MNKINTNSISKKNPIPKFNIENQLYSYSNNYYKDIKRQNSSRRSNKEENNTYNNNNSNNNDKENQIDNFDSNIDKDKDEDEYIKINTKKDFEKSYLECKLNE